MNTRTIAALAALGLPLALSGALAERALAHGSMASPPSRDFFCRFLDRGGVEDPQTDGCKAAKARSGTSPIYEWEESLIRNAARRGLDAVADGQICNAGQSRRSGLNLSPQDANYTAMPVTPGRLSFQYRATTPHPTERFRVFISKPGYDGSAVLQKSDLTLLKNFERGEFFLAGDSFRFDVDMPQRTAGSQAVVVVVWELPQLQSDEGYYTCSDVVYR